MSRNREVPPVPRTPVPPCLLPAVCRIPRLPLGTPCGPSFPGRPAGGNGRSLARALYLVLYHLLNAASPELRKRDINQTPTKSTILFLVQYLPNHAEVFLYRRNTGPRTAAHPRL